MDYSIEEDAKKLMPQRDFAGDAGLVPYRVELDKGAKVPFSKHTWSID